MLTDNIDVTSYVPTSVQLMYITNVTLVTKFSYNYNNNTYYVKSNLFSHYFKLIFLLINNNILFIY